MNRDWIKIFNRYTGTVRHRRIVATLALLAALASCSEQGKRHTKHGALQLVTTIAPTSVLVEAIAGGTAQAHTLLPQGNTPESYEPTPKDMATLAQASAYIYVGNLGFERSWLSRIAALYPNLRLISTAPEHDSLTCTSHQQTNYEHDPHYWVGIRGIRSMARQVYDVLCSYTPQNDSIYLRHYTALTKQIDALEIEIRNLLTSTPNRAFVIYHPSLTDFADEFGYKQLVIEQDGKEPTPQQLASLISQAKSMGVRVVFIQREFDQKLAQSVAEELGAQCVEINPLSGDWAGQLRLIAHSLSQP